MLEKLEALITKITNKIGYKVNKSVLLNQIVQICVIINVMTYLN